MIYVDWIQKCDRNNIWNYDQFCHLYADTKEELINFAVKIGLKPEWLQKSNFDIYHFDLTINKRNNAIANGAYILTRQELIILYRRLKRN